MGRSTDPIEQPGIPTAPAARGRWTGGLAQPDLVAVAGILVPGLGHVLQGRLRAGAGWFVAILLGYWAVFFPGAVLHAISVLAAYRGAVRARGGAD